MTTIVELPKRRNTYLVFDVETTGLLPKTSNIRLPRIEEYPHIIQLSFAVFNIDTKEVIQKYDAYIKIDESVVISDLITGLTGVTYELCKTQGKRMIDVLYEFYKAYIQCDGLVAHNMDFDEKMILLEVERNRDQILLTIPPCLTIFNPTYEKFRGIDRYCTMKYGTNICNILVDSRFGGRPPSKKWPKLIELYKHLFNGETVDGLHNSMIDVFACMRCYLKMRHNIDTLMVTN
jgi:DNA polymerase III epsilon subunit-like protein